MSNATPVRRTRRASTHTGILAPVAAPTAIWIAALVAVVLVVVGGVALHASAVDLAAVRGANGLHTGGIAAITNAIYTVFSPVEAVLLTALATVVVWIVRRDLRPAVAFAVVIAVTWLPSAVVKIVVARPRPDAALLPHPFSPVPVDASYPSGHTVFVVAAAIATVALLRDTRFARLSVLVAPIVVLVVVLALLVDGVHFPTDVLASIVWAVGMAPLVRMLWVRQVAPRVPLLR